ncbi:hypothetical protein STSP2_02848 [Anaerohalosphaera lusitana]|uniref:Ysc84 actin-binding domain-containing protein n=1 Tax=Anaerohalosphaera lusitana TaxID=1936003 RepID=A0A1U9NPI4_9BACT|nr:lipid-binding SYLF domain-containing protein [Anaerohalosphaera lusitana]AQT69654.1 hypothetical protein STSP2_02848 [Anaerohalosphaera lusitana]
MRTFTKHLVLLVVSSMAICITGCATAPKSAESKDVLQAQAQEAIAAFKQKSPGIQRFLDESAGYAVLPKVVKGGFWLGGAYGKGIVYEGGSRIGYCDMTQATLGFTFGGEYFREIIFFRDSSDLQKFKTGEFTFSAQATAIAATSGAASKADYKDGYAVFVLADKGLMVDASIGGQKFDYLSEWQAQ